MVGKAMANLASCVNTLVDFRAYLHNRRIFEYEGRGVPVRSVVEPPNDRIARGIIMRDLVAAVLAATALLCNTGSLAACISTAGAPGVPEDVPTDRVQKIGISIDELLHGQTEIKREVSTDATGSPFTTVDIAQRLSVITEGNNANLSRFSINLSPWGDEAERIANWRSSLAVVINAFQASGTGDSKDAVSWYLRLIDDLTSGMKDDTKNVFLVVREKGKFEVTAIAMRRPSAVITCFEPRSN
jgi:hypothetical protein